MKATMLIIILALLCTAFQINQPGAAEKRVSVSAGSLFK
jgi:hypothetical protein